jgi:hypothetical protein
MTEIKQFALANAAPYLHPRGGMVSAGATAGRHQQDRPARAGTARGRAAGNIVKGCRRCRGGMLPRPACGERVG